MESTKIGEIIEGFRRHLNTEKAKSHISWLREKEPREVKEILNKLQSLPRARAH